MNHQTFLFLVRETKIPSILRILGIGVWRKRCQGYPHLPYVTWWTRVSQIRLSIGV
jgi:hypothetical protein